MISTPRPENVRVAGPDDRVALLELFLEAHADNGMMPIDPGKVRAAVDALCRYPHDAHVGVAGVIDGDAGQLVGCAALAFMQPWYSNGWAIEDRLIFVLPAVRRGTRHARDLLQFSRWYAETVGLPLIAGVLTTKRIEAKAKLYRRYMTPAGGIFIHNAEAVGV